MRQEASGLRNAGYPTESKPLKIILDTRYQNVILALLNWRDFCRLTPMPARHVPLATLSKSSGLTQLSFCEHIVPVTTFRINTYSMPTSVDSKELTEKLNPLSATLTKNRGEGCRLQRSFQPPPPNRWPLLHPAHRRYSNRNHAGTVGALRTGNHARNLFARDSGRAASRSRKRGETCIWSQIGPKFGLQRSSVGDSPIKK